MEIEFEGKYTWENWKQYPNIRSSGIYIWSIPYKNRELAYYIGMSKNMFFRTSTHQKNYETGYYQTFDPSLFEKGKKVHVWMGRWRYDNALRKKDISQEEYSSGLDDYHNNLDYFKSKQNDFLGLMNIFFCPVKMKARELKRIESAIALNIIYKGGIGAEFQEPITVGSFFPQLRRIFEHPIRIRIRNNNFHNLDNSFEA